MSNLARIIVIGTPLVDEKLMRYINVYLTKLGVGTFKRVDDSADGGRPFVEDVWMGCFNYLPLEEMLKQFLRHTQCELDFVIHREHDDRPWMCSINKEYMPVIPKETGI